MVKQAKTKSALRKLNKRQLEDYGRTVGIELDRRLKKETLLLQLEEHTKAPGVIKTVTEAVKSAITGEVLLRDANKGFFYKGKKPSGSRSGTSGGVPFWEV
jgi:hypothetical protein